MTQYETDWDRKYAKWDKNWPIGTNYAPKSYIFGHCAYYKT